ncbi:CotH kinase family protein [Treponema vincentii]|uniref:CotH kinase family protein n=1 Tax=Treponema vincentii TaxID=69710 RepID=UPI0020A50BFD|nr:CotH kinase family protein [Treponema vincentii]UTC48243.1 hypothetical protein E4N73_05075 [Treponema vincentii]
MEEGFTSVALTKDKKVLYRSFLIIEDTIYILVPSGSDLVNLSPKFINRDKRTYKYETAKDFSDFTHPQEYTLKSSTGEIKTWKILLCDLPVLTITTPDNQEIASKERSVENCAIKLFSLEKHSDLGKASIKVRGNSTALQPKKPYNVKLSKSQSILGMKSSKKWVLLSNPYYDRSQLHNALAFEIARLTDYKWVQSGRFVEVLLNGVHQGLYYLCEKIDVEKGKIEIKELKSDDLDEKKITGGYFLETDIFVEGSSSEEANSFVTDYFNKTGTNTIPCVLGWYLKSPSKNIPQAQLNYIKNKMNELESLIYDDEKLLTGEYRKYLDVETVINWWLIEELCLNEEASRTKNLYMYKNRNDEKFYIGPPWDFDAWTFGLTGTRKFYAKSDAFYYSQLFKDPYFVNRVKEKWRIYKTKWRDRIPTFIDAQYKLIHNAAERNETLWTDWHKVNQYPEKTYHQLVLDIKQAFIDQLEWMGSEIENYKGE